MSLPVAIVHYHLRRGGVTRVIEHASSFLTGAGLPHVILSGSPAESDEPLPVEVIGEIGYDTERGGPVTGLRIAHSLRKAAEEALGTNRFIWHFHNHSLGKNRHLSDAAGILAVAGDPMVLQYHDFAEDGRASSYPCIADSETLYPYASQIRHTFINSRDLHHFLAAGLPEEHTYLHPNPIVTPALPDPLVPPSEDPLVLYPVRGIRRKNLGELFLLAALAPPGTRFAVTLAPANPIWQPIHRDWEAFAKDTGLPVVLDAAGNVPPAAGVPPTFESWIRHATHIITTSVAEGFGLNFLEPATLGKPLIGRNLPAVTNDFAHQGIHPGHLYDRLLVPEEWVGLETLRQRLVRSMRENLENYGFPMSNEHLESSFDAMRFQGHLDFGNLPEDLQHQVIHRILAGSDRERVLTDIRGQPLTEWLKANLANREPTVVPDQLENYSPKSYLTRLLDVYRHVEQAPAQPPSFLPKHKVLARFNQPGSFHFLLA